MGQSTWGGRNKVGEQSRGKTREQQGEMDGTVPSTDSTATIPRCVQDGASYFQISNVNLIMHPPASDDPPPRAAIRERLRRMTDAQLAAHGRALQYMTDPSTQREIRATYRVQIQEARAEWKRRRFIQSGSGVPSSSRQ